MQLMFTNRDGTNRRTWSGESHGLAKGKKSQRFLSFGGKGRNCVSAGMLTGGRMGRLPDDSSRTTIGLVLLTTVNVEGRARLRDGTFRQCAVMNVNN